MDFAKIICWVRVSSEEQAKEGKAGIDRQESAIRMILTGYRSPDVRWVYARGVSGETVAHSREWREEVTPHLGPSTLIVASDQDRVIRMRKLQLGVLPELLDTETRLVTREGLQDFQSFSSQLTVMFSALKGGQELADIIARTSGGREEKRQKGMWVGRQDMLPTGVSYRKGQGWGYTDEAPKVVETFRRFVAGEAVWSISQSFGWTSSRVYSILRNWIYKGIARWTHTTDTSRIRISAKGRKLSAPKIQREIPLEVRVFPPEKQLITDELWDRAQALLATRRDRDQAKRTKNMGNIPYSSFLVPAAPPDIFPPGQVVELNFEAPPTRHRIYGVHHGKRTEIRYMCRCRITRWGITPKCDWGTPRADVVNAAIDKFIANASTDKAFLDAVLASLPPVEDLTKQLDGWREKDTKIKAQLKRANKLLLEEKIDDDEHAELKKDLQTEQQQVLQQIQELESRLAVAGNPQDVIDRVKGWVYDPKWDVEKKRKWLVRHLDHLAVSRWGIEAVVLKLTDGGKTQWVGGLGNSSWEALLGYDIYDAAGRWASKGALTDVQMAQLVGVTTAAIRQAKVRGRIKPSAPSGHFAQWTMADVEAVKAVMLKPPPRPNPVKALQDQGWVTSGQLQAALGISQTKVVDWVAAGRIPQPDAVKSRRRLWKRETVAHLLKP